MECANNNLNIFLSNLNVFYRKLQNYHWNAKGKDFFAIHIKLEEYYNEINEQIDEVAEHMLMIQKRPFGTMKDYLENTTLEEANNEEINSCEIIKNLICDFEKMLNDVKIIKKEADEENYYSTSSLMDNYIQTYEKNLWMLKQSC